MKTRMCGALVALVAVTAVAAAVCTPAAAEEDDRGPWYYYMVVDDTGQASVDQMCRDDARHAEKNQVRAYKEALKEWTGARKEWYSVMGKKPYPVPAPSRPKLKRLGRLPSTEKKREKALERYHRRIQVWSVCIATDTAGDRTAEAIRRDKIFTKRRDLLKEYAGALMEWQKAIKADPDAKKDEKPLKKPGVIVVKDGIHSSELAEKVAEKLNEKLAKEAEKRAELEKEKQ